MNNVVVVRDNDLLALAESDVLNIIRFGADLSEDIKSTSRQVLELVSIKDDTTDVVNSLQKVMMKIKPDEIKELTDSKKGLKKMLSNVFGMKNQLIAKYTSITDELDGMYTSVKTKSLRLENNNKVLNDFGNNCISSQEKLKQYLAHACQELELMESQEFKDEKDMERINVLKQKIGDLRSLELVIDQTVKNIDVTKKTNYLVYKKMFSVYDTVLPTIQNQVALNEISKQHKTMIEELQAMDKLKNDLIVSTARDTAQAGIDAINLLDGGESTYEAIKEARRIFDQGFKEMKQLELNKIKGIELTLLEYKKEEN